LEIARRTAETKPAAKTPKDQARQWLPFLNTYRTMCLAPQPDFLRILQDIRDLRLAA
jgi:hypothetical protein